MLLFVKFLMEDNPTAHDFRRLLHRAASVFPDGCRFLLETMGRRQVVRHRVLDPAFGGSNPPAPAIFN